MTTKDYMKLPYNINIQYHDDASGKYYVARVLEFEGCFSDGETQEQALTNLKEAMELWIETKLENGWEVPLPKTRNEYSGKFVVRIPKTLHRKLAEKAEEEGISLNQYALYKLSN